METDIQQLSAKQIKRAQSAKSQKVNRLVFYISMFILPIAVVVVFYIYVSFQSFLMAFENYTPETGFYFDGVKRFAEVINAFKVDEYLLNSIKNSLELFLWTFVFSAMLAVFFSYYIYKKHPLHGTFKVILYLPHIISSVVFVVMYKYFVDIAVVDVAGKLGGSKNMLGLLANPETRRTTIIFYSIWVSFGVNVLMYTSAMSSISPSIIESAGLDGITPIKEMWHIVIPGIWPTFVTFMIVSIVGIFTNQMSLYTFYGTQADRKLYTFGYYLYIGVLEPEVLGLKSGMNDYPFLSAMGMLLTAIAIPITLVARYLFNKFGPRTD